MSPYSSDSEVFGAKALYAAMVVLSVLVLFAAVASTLPGAPARADASAPVQTLAVSAQAGQVS